jgi:hypothetical protein
MERKHRPFRQGQQKADSLRQLETQLIEAKTEEDGARLYLTYRDGERTRVAWATGRIAVKTEELSRAGEKVRLTIHQAEVVDVR